MAEVKTDSPEYAVERAGVSKEELHKEMLTRHDECRDYWRSEYELARQDMEFAFLPDGQWDDWMKDTRTGRPCYTVNKVRQSMKQITNDQRQNRPQAKVRAEEEGDADLAEIRQGLLRNIDSKLDAQRAVDTAFQFAVGGGFGVWRITTGYQDDGGFDQVIQREEIANPYSVVFDPAAKKKDRRDARYAFVDCQWSRAAFREKWPDAKLVSVDNTTDADKGWWDEHEVTVSEYWYKATEQVEIVLMSDGSVYDAGEIAAVADELAAQGVTEQRRRVHDRETVQHCIVSGAEIIEGPTQWAGRFIPLIPVWGELITLKDKERFFGAVRFAKDPQRMYNYERSTFIEVLADQPYSPFMADAKSIEGYESQYQSMRTKKPPVLFYNSDASAPDGGKPSRESPPIFPAALANAAQISGNDINDALGIHDAGLGKRSNETSGKAILARQREGDIANFDYIDNLAYSLKYDFEVINDLLTEVYDTERQIRIIGEDGAEKVERINVRMRDEQTGQVVTLQDMSQGRYDISVTVGPSYTTQRMESAEAMMQLATDPSPIGMVAKYGFIKSLDAPGLEDVRKAARKILVGQGLLEPEDGDQPPQPPPPDPRAEAQVRKMLADAERSAASAHKTNAEAQAVMPQAQADIQKTIAEAVAQQLENMMQSGQLAMLAQQYGPPPMQPFQTQPNLPPQGGFLPGPPGQPPQGTAPGGFQGMPS